MAEKQTMTAAQAQEPRPDAAQDAALDSLADEMKRVLDAQPKVAVRIPKIGTDPNKPDPNDAIPIPVTINGYSYYIKRGEKVEVPQTVADILEESGYLR